MTRQPVLANGTGGESFVTQSLKLDLSQRRSVQRYLVAPIASVPK